MAKQERDLRRVAPHPEHKYVAESANVIMENVLK